MRFVWAVVAFVLATLMIGAGVAQRTVFEGEKTYTQSVKVAGDAPYILVDGDVFNSHPGSQVLRVAQAGQIFAAYGRTDDLTAWLARTDYAHVTVKADAVKTATVEATDPQPADAAPLVPAGSDLWLDEFDKTDSLVVPLQIPDDMSVLIATDGQKPAPSAFTLTWPIRNVTPWAGPLIVAGSILLAVGVFLYFLALRHIRRSRGPRRKGLPILPTEPIDLEVEGDDRGVISSTPSRRALTRGKRRLLAIPAVALVTSLFAGCSPDAWPQFGSSPTPSASASVAVPADQAAPVVTQAQAERILTRIADATAKADEAHDAALAAERLDGTMLAVRETNYRLIAAIPEEKPLAAIPTGPLDVTLPEANAAWPRTFFAVVSPAGGDSQILSITQQDPWSAYKLNYAADVVRQTDLNLAPDYVGAIPIPGDSPFLAVAPDQVAAAYADVLDHGDGSAYAEDFELTDDSYLKQVQDSRAKNLAAFNETGAETANLVFSSKSGDTPPVALATLDSGAIVAVTVNEFETATPKNEDVVIKFDANARSKALTGVSESKTGIETTYATQLFFFIPSESSKKRVQLLAATSVLLDSKVLP